MKILFLDDDVDRYQHLCKYKPSWIEIVHVSTVLEAQEWMMNREFDLLMLDHDLGANAPGGDGIELARWISRKTDDFKWNPDCQIIIHSMNPIGAGNMVSEFGLADIRAVYIPGAWTKMYEENGNWVIKRTF